MSDEHDHDGEPWVCDEDYYDEEEAEKEFEEAMKEMKEFDAELHENDI